jgi:hypothetical protein
MSTASQPKSVLSRPMFFKESQKDGCYEWRCTEGEKGPSGTTYLHSDSSGIVPRYRLPLKLFNFVTQYDHTIKNSHPDHWKSVSFKSTHNFDASEADIMHSIHKAAQEAFGESGETSFVITSNEAFTVDGEWTIVDRDDTLLVIQGSLPVTVAVAYTAALGSSS